MCIKFLQLDKEHWQALNVGGWWIRSGTQFLPL